MLFPPLIRQEMLPEESYPLNNGESIQLRIADESDLEDIILIQEACYQGKAPWGRMAVNNELRNKHTAFFLWPIPHKPRLPLSGSRSEMIVCM